MKWTEHIRERLAAKLDKATASKEFKRQVTVKKARGYRMPPSKARGTLVRGYVRQLVRAYNKISQNPTNTSSRQVKSVDDVKALIANFIQAVRKNRKVAKSIVGNYSAPNDCRLVEGKTACDHTNAKQFIRAALDEISGVTLRYETFPTVKDRTNIMNGSLYLSVWDLMLGYFDGGAIDAAAAERWLRYHGFVTDSLNEEEHPFFALQRAYKTTLK